MASSRFKVFTGAPGGSGLPLKAAKIEGGLATAPLPARMRKMVTGKNLMCLGLALAALGGLIWIAETRGWSRATLLPGDIAYRGKSFTIVFPLATCIVLSLVLSLLSRWLNR